MERGWTVLAAKIDLLAKLVLNGHRIFITMDNNSQFIWNERAIYQTLFCPYQTTVHSAVTKKKCI